MTDPVLHLVDVQRTTDGVDILRGVDWTIDPGQHWVVLGPNGCGKTTLVRIASMWLHPSAGRVEVLGERLGRTDVRTLRERVGLRERVDGRPAARPDLLVADVVMTARNAALEPWWHDYDDADRAAADRRAGAVSASPTWPTVDSAPVRRASASGCSSPGRCRPTRGSSSSTNPPLRSTSPVANSSCAC